MSERAEHRALGLLDLTCLGLNAIVGSSVFLFPGRLADFLGPASFLAFGLTGLMLISVGLCFAEAATLYDRAGGPYLYAREAFGDWTGYSIGWLSWITQIFSWAAVANAIAVYLGFFRPAWGSPAAVKAVAALVIVAMGVINYRGVKLGAWTSDFFTAAKLLPLLAFVIIGLPHVDFSRFHPFAPHGWRPMGQACFLAYFAFQGFEYIPVPSGETKDPARNVPIALIVALVGAALLYMAIQAVAVGVAPGLAASDRPLADAAVLVMGGAGGTLMALGAVFSTTGYNAGAALVTPRYLVALAEDGHLPPRLAAPHPRFDTPYLAILATTGITLLFALFFDFNKLVEAANVVVCAQYLATCAAVPVLRRLRSAPAGSFRLPGGAAIPVIGLLATGWLGAQGSLAQLGWSAAILAVGLAFKAAYRARDSRRHSHQPLAASARKTT